MAIEHTSGMTLCAVIGNPIGHSLSPTIHNGAYVAAGLAYEYRAFEVSDVAEFIGELRATPDFRGVSVTIPHKLAVIEHLDEIEPMARHVGSVNTITHEGDRLIGSTTDGPGTLRAFAEAGVSLHGKRVLFLGAGGAVRAVAFAFADAGAEAVHIAARDEGRAVALAQDIASGTGCAVEGCPLGPEIESIIDAADVIVQGTPIGMAPNDDVSIIPASCITSDHVVFDMVYRPLRTRLLRDAEAAGATTITGLEMLIYQAALQFERWTGVDCPVDAMRTAALDALGEAS